jgi:hypothetical protein
MPPIVVLALGAFAAGAIVHRVIKEVRRINTELDRVKTGRAIDPVSQDGGSQKNRGLRLPETSTGNSPLHSLRS